jgi:hypothetical protein
MSPASNLLSLLVTNNEDYNIGEILDNAGLLTEQDCTDKISDQLLACSKRAFLILPIERRTLERAKYYIDNNDDIWEPVTECAHLFDADFIEYIITTNKRHLNIIPEIYLTKELKDNFLQRYSVGDVDFDADLFFFFDIDVCNESLIKLAWAQYPSISEQITHKTMTDTLLFWVLDLNPNLLTGISPDVFSEKQINIILNQPQSGEFLFEYIAGSKFIGDGSFVDGMCKTPKFGVIYDRKCKGELKTNKNLTLWASHNRYCSGFMTDLSQSDAKYNCVTIALKNGAVAAKFIKQLLPPECVKAHFIAAFAELSFPEKIKCNKLFPEL